MLPSGRQKSWRLCLLSGGSVGESVAVAGRGDDVGVVAEPIEQRDGGGLVGQESAQSLNSECEPITIERRS